ncbi:MAG: hypothetical protein HON53_15460, partial [Planctomycetaceae bacterium]|nr:hypothetical protein [Planctomycetaceae bacterium]
HILKAAMEALDDNSRQLLSTLALLSEAVDYPTLCALNPHLPPVPEQVEKPEKPGEGGLWQVMPDDWKEQKKQDYPAALKRWEECEQALQDRLESLEFLDAPQKLQETVANLERRGLLQYDTLTKRHDLHPVLRGIAAGGLRQEETERYGQRVVDHFSQQAHNPYDEAETLEDLRDGLHVVRTLLQMGHHQQACDVYRGDLSRALLFNLEAHAETLSLLRPFFPQGWATLPSGLNESACSYLANSGANALAAAGEFKQAFAAYSSALFNDLAEEGWSGLCIRLANLSRVLRAEVRLAKQERCLVLALDIAAQQDDIEYLFVARLDHFQHLAGSGQWTKAETIWQLLDPMGRDWRRNLYRPGHAEQCYARFRFYKEEMTKEHLDHAEQLAKTGKNRPTVRGLHGLRGEWQLDQGQYQLAAESLHEAVHMARQVGQIDAEAETRLALAKIHLGQLADARDKAEQLATAKSPAHRPLAELWLAIGDREQAKKHALAAYEWAWADGEPYVRRYELNQSQALLEKLGVEIPKLPPYDPEKDEKLPWEDEVAAAIDKLRAENEATQAAEENSEE